MGKRLINQSFSKTIKYEIQIRKASRYDLINKCDGCWIPLIAIVGREGFSYSLSFTAC